MNVAEALSDRIREIVRAELDRRGVKRPKLAQELGISLHRLNHMLKPVREGQKAPTAIPPALLEQIREKLRLPEGWPVTVLRTPDTPGFLSVHEARATYGLDVSYVEGSDRADHVPAEFVAQGFQLLVMPDDSMMPALQEGDILAVSPQLKIRTGFPHAVTIEDLATVRLVDHDGRDYVVSALNPKYPAAPLESELLGIVVGRVWIDENGERRSRINPLGLRLT